MQRTLFLLTVLLSSLILAACSAAQATDAQSNAAANPTADSAPAAIGTPAPGGDRDRNLPLAMQLALGTFKLEDTDHPVSAEQAKDLLPLWKALRSLGDSETTAAQELEAVINQIQGAMTPEQMTDIQAMQLSFQDMQSLSQELGLQFGMGGGFGEMSPEMQATIEAARQSGQAPGGGGFQGGPGGFPGGGPPDMGGVGPEVRQTAMASGGGRRNSGLNLPPGLLDALIKLLEEKAQ